MHRYDGTKRFLESDSYFRSLVASDANIRKKMDYIFLRDPIPAALSHTIVHPVTMTTPTSSAAAATWGTPATKSKLALHEAIAMNDEAPPAQAMPMERLDASQHGAAQALYAHHMGAPARMETSMQMPAQAEMVRQQQYAASVGLQPSMLQPQAARRLKWQEHLVGWQIQVEQYTLQDMPGARTHTTRTSAHTARSP